MKKLFLITLTIWVCYNSMNNKTNQTFNANLSNEVPRSLEAQVDALVKQYEDLEIFSGVVLIAENGNPIYHKAFGLADREENRPNTLNTNLTGDKYHPDISTDGTKLTFYATIGDVDNEHKEIYISNNDGSNIKRLTNNLTTSFHFKFTPDGKKISLTNKSLQKWISMNSKL